MIYDCRRGECGLCALHILEVDGIVDHRDVFFSDAQHQRGDRMCTCVSRVVSARTGGASVADGHDPVLTIDIP